MAGELPRGWIASTVGDIAVDSRERFDPADDELAACPYVGLEHVDPGAATITRFGSSKDVGSQKTRFLADDVLFGKLRPYLRKVARVDRAGVCSTDIIAIRPRPGTDAGFLLTVLASDEAIRHATASSAGTKMPRTSWDELAAFNLLLPPLPEQKNIAAILSSVDDAIRATEAVMEQTRRVKQALLQELLTRGIGHTRFKMTEIGEIPEGWQVRPAHAVCVAVIDCKNRTPPETETGFAVVRTPNVRGGAFVRGGLKFTDASNYKVWTERGEPAAGDVLITREAPVGEVALLPQDIGPACLGQRLMMYRPDALVMNNQFMLAALLSPGIQAQLLRLAGGSTVGHVRVDDIRTLKVPVPPIAEQCVIATAINSVDSGLMHSETTLTRLVRSKSALLSALLSGCIRVTP